MYIYIYIDYINRFDLIEPCNEVCYATISMLSFMLRIV